MAESGEYALTHAPPNDAELTLLITFIDQQVHSDLLRHSNRMSELLDANGLIARSITEHHFLARILSMYAQTMAIAGSVGANGRLNTASLHIRGGSHEGCAYYAIVSTSDNLSILRGQTRNTSAGAMECFIDAVLLTGERFRMTIGRQRNEWLDGVRTDGEEEDSRRNG